MTIQIASFATEESAKAAAVNWKRGDDPILYLRDQDDVAFRAKLCAVLAIAADLDGTLARTNTFRELEKGMPHDLVAHGQATLRAHIAYVSRQAELTRPSETENLRGWLARMGPESDLERIASDGGLMANNIIGLVRSGFNKERLRQLVESKRARDGAQALCGKVKRAVVVSAGFENVGEAFLWHHNFPGHVEIIAGFRLIFDAEGLIKGVEHLLFPSMLKGVLVKRVREEHYGMDRKHLLCVGDLPFDAPLLREGGVAIGLLPPEDEDVGAFHHRMLAFPEYWQSVDAMLVGDSLQPLADLLEETAAA